MYIPIFKVLTNLLRIWKFIKNLLKSTQLKFITFIKY